MSVLDIAVEIERLRLLARDGKLSPGDLTGGTFTLSNIGNIGGTLLHPVLVTSEVCIGAIGKMQVLPRYDSKDQSQIVPTEILNVSFNADHRVIDGATVGRFVQLWKLYLEQPSLLTVRLK
jgi:2-oxoisovalerate dehydrogenase E2 component (dihydrolipoyl transacylase)